MKKFLALLMAAMMVFAFVACTSEEVVEETAAEEVVEEVAEATEEAAE